MKIKRFKEEIRKVSKYFIDDMSAAYYIFRVDKQYEDDLEVTKIYSYHPELGLEKIEDQSAEKYEISLRDFVIIFESNSLKKTKDYLMMLIDANKYNV